MLALYQETRLVRTQFHVQHNHCYHSTREEQQKTPDLWMIKAGLVGSKRQQLKPQNKKSGQGIHHHKRIAACKPE
jgi:hypothetical protein